MLYCWKLHHIQVLKDAASEGLSTRLAKWDVIAVYLIGRIAPLLKLQPRGEQSMSRFSKQQAYTLQCLRMDCMTKHKLPGTLDRSILMGEKQQIGMKVAIVSYDAYVARLQCAGISVYYVCC